MDEQDFIKLYMQLIGSAESAAKNVFMYVCPSDHSTTSEGKNSRAQAWLPSNGDEVKDNGKEHSSRGIVGLLILLSLWLSTSALQSNETVSPGTITNQTDPPKGNSAVILQPFGGPLTLPDAINLALHQSPNILRAQKDLEATQGIVIQTRAIALPTVGIAGSYGAVERTDIDIFELPPSLSAPRKIGLRKSNWSNHSTKAAACFRRFGQLD